MKNETIKKKHKKSPAKIKSKALNKQEFPASLFCTGKRPQFCTLVSRFFNPIYLTTYHLYPIYSPLYHLTPLSFNTLSFHPDFNLSMK